MKPFWHPLATLFLPQPRCYASSAMIRMMLAGEGAAELIYGGDRMWPAVRHGQQVRVEPCQDSEVAVGDVLVVECRGIPDLLRVVRATPRGRFLLRGDSDPSHGVEVGGAELLGHAALNARAVSQAKRHLHRWRLEMTEALCAAADHPEAEDRAQTVRRKYDAQAPFYAASDREEISTVLLERMRRVLPAGGAVLVVGSGSGRECFALRRAGYGVKGVDFSAAMTAVARAGAERHRLDIEFVEADIREHFEEAGSLSGILFTYESYSFLPSAASRKKLLRRMAGWLAAGGAIFLSARPLSGIYQRSILSLQRLRFGPGAAGAWGDSHTRYLEPDGALRRSFVHYFTSRRLLREAASAGLALERFFEGYFELRGKPEDEAS